VAYFGVKVGRNGNQAKADQEHLHHPESQGECFAMATAGSVASMVWIEWLRLDRLPVGIPNGATSTEPHAERMREFGGILLQFANKNICYKFV
jgi:hypothetical protein